MWRGLIALLIVAGATACVSGGADADDEEATSTRLPSGPATEQIATPEPYDSRIEGDWILVEINGLPTIRDTWPTLTISSTGIDGYTGCAAFGLERSPLVGDGQMNFREYYIDDAGCETKALTAQHAAFLEGLRNALTYRVDGDRLVMLDGDGLAALAFVRDSAYEWDPALLVGTEWLLVGFDGGPRRPSGRVTLEIEAGSFGGFAGCNWYGGQRSPTTADVLGFVEIESTARECESPSGVMRQETDFLAALEEAVGFRITGAVLRLVDAGGQERLAFARQPVHEEDPSALIGTSWRLTHVDGVEPLPESDITLEFGRQAQNAGFAGCRGYTGSYIADEKGRIRFPTLGMDATECERPIEYLHQEGEFTTALSEAERYWHNEGWLTIQTAPGTQLGFERVEN